MMYSFIFKDLNKAEEVARQYLELIEQQDIGGTLQFVNIHRYFYGGLIAFDCFRRTQEGQVWMNIGNRSLSKFESWPSKCEWNFNAVS